MSTPRSALHQTERGLGLIELLVALGVFVLFFLLIDAVFVGTHRSARKAELASDVQQNARIAIERLTREIRESRCSTADCQVQVGGPAGTMRVAFKSARRLADAPETFCVYVRTTTEPLYNASCRANLAAGDQTPPGSCVDCGTYKPHWQYWVAYWTEDLGGGNKQLHRAFAALSSPTAALPDATNDALWVCPSVFCGEVIATYVSNFNVSIVASNGNFIVALDAIGTKYVQGTSVPQQEILLNGTTLVRN